MNKMFMISQRLLFESNSQPVRGCRSSHRRCLWYPKDFYLKAIPNRMSSITAISLMFMISQRLLFESNSQRNGVYKGVVRDVYDIPKTFIWKQFPTTMPPMAKMGKMFVISQRLLFESNSQLTVAVTNSPLGCLWYPKDFYLKAITNQERPTSHGTHDVCDISKTFIWKLFQKI